VKARAYAKVNLALEVGPIRRGLHTIRSISQSISWDDLVELTPADDDRLDVPAGGAPDDAGNVAWKALELVRAHGKDVPVHMVVDKRVPAMAGLGGGSADAAAAVALACRVLGVDVVSIEPELIHLGSDVPFAMRGGTAVVGGVGETISALPPAAGFAIALVVPPIELATADVYRRWDELEGPQGPTVAAGALPPQLRDLAPLRNDLYPAAASLDPSVDDWRGELADRWGIPVAMSGSGAALFGLFPAVDEASDALRSAPSGAMATRAAKPVPVGWTLLDDAEPAR
jgi:4-diphosphocytidyl-2-C-methyl-D-erythritol kinase